MNAFERRGNAQRKAYLEWRAQGPHILPGVRGTSGVNIPLVFPQNNWSSVSGRQPWLAPRPGLEHSPELAGVSGPGEPAAEVGLDPSESLMSRDNAGFCTTGPVTLWKCATRTTVQGPLCCRHNSMLACRASGAQPERDFGLRSLGYVAYSSNFLFKILLPFPVVPSLKNLSKSLGVPGPLSQGQQVGGGRPTSS